MFMFCSTRKRQLIKAAKEKGFIYHTEIPYSLKQLLQIKCDSGLLILSKYKILSSDYIYYSYGCTWDSFSAKGVLTALIEVDNRKIRVFTTHAQASYRHDSVISDKSVRKRSKQLRQMAAFISKYRRLEPTIPVVLMGDLNVDGLNVPEEYEQMIGIFRKNHLVEMENVLFTKYGKHKTTFGGTGDDLPVDPRTGERIQKEVYFSNKEAQESNACIDYIFWDSKGTAEFVVDYQNSYVDPLPLHNQQLATQVSDHYGVSLCLKLENKARH